MKHTIDYKERVEMVRAMDLIARNINDEDVLDYWLACGVADGDITENTTDKDLKCYCDDNSFRDLMDCFLVCMKNAYKSGGLYCDHVVTKEG